MIDVNRASLDNGLRIVHSRVPTTAMAAVNIIYDVGSRDESPDLTGIAHLFEHLMFSGSQNVKNFDKALEAAGGMSNAWTSQDFTNFYDIIPTHNIETAFWLESDRMLSLSFSENALNVQRSVVIEEFKQTCLNQPYGDLYHHLYSLAYTTHPYRYPTIGKEIGHIAQVTNNDVRQWFFAHYAPNNAVLAVVSDINFKTVVELAQKWFGPIPRRDIPPRHLPMEPGQTEARRRVVEGNVPQTMIVKAFPMPAHNANGYRACDIITDLLAFGQSSRFFRNLVIGSPLFSYADAAVTGTQDPGLLMLTARLADENELSVATAEHLLIDEASRLFNDPDSLTTRELQRSINRFESNLTFGLMSNAQLASQLATCELQGTDINTLVDDYSRITPDEIRHTARQILSPSRCNTLIYRPSQMYNT